MRKTILPIFAAIFIVSLFLPAAAQETADLSAEWVTVEQGDLEIKLYDDRTAILTKYVGSDTDAVLWASPMRFEYPEDHWYVLDHITSIAAGAFYGCDTVENVYILPGMTRIESGAFDGAPSIVNVYFIGSAEDFSALDCGGYGVTRIEAGDLDRDGVLTIADASVIYEYIIWKQSGNEGSPPFSSFVIADVWSNNAVDSRDLYEFMKKITANVSGSDEEPNGAVRLNAGGLNKISEYKYRFDVYIDGAEDAGLSSYVFTAEVPEGYAITESQDVSPDQMKRSYSYFFTDSSKSEPEKIGITCFSLDQYNSKGKPITGDSVKICSFEVVCVDKSEAACELSVRIMPDANSKNWLALDKTPRGAIGCEFDAWGMRSGDWSFSVVRDTDDKPYAAVTRYYGDEKDVVIPDTLGGFPVAAIGRFVFATALDIKSVTIPEGVNAIAELAFNGTLRLETVYFRGSADEWNGITVGDYNDPLKKAVTVIGLNGETEVKANSPGDVNGDGKLNAKDVTLMMKRLVRGADYDAGWDVNGDGRFNAKDVVALMKMIVSSGTHA